MAEPIGVASGLLALSTFALESSISIYQLVSRLNSRPKKIRELVDELETLVSVLGSLERAVAGGLNNLLMLKLPLLRCGQACKELETVIRDYTTHSDRSHANFPDWAKLKHIYKDVDAYKNTLAGYKATISITLGNANLHAISVTADVFEKHKALVANTMSELEEHLRHLDTKLQAILVREDNALDESKDRARLEAEKQNAEQCISICTQVNEQAGRLPPNIGQRRTVALATEINTDIFEDISEASNAHETIVTTLGDLISAKRIVAGPRSVTLLGQMSDESLRQLSSEIRIDNNEHRPAKGHHETSSYSVSFEGGSHQAHRGHEAHKLSEPMSEAPYLSLNLIRNLALSLLLTKSAKEDLRDDFGIVELLASLRMSYDFENDAKDTGRQLSSAVGDMLAEAEHQNFANLRRLLRRRARGIFRDYVEHLFFCVTESLRSPPKANQTRIYWTCGCGKDQVADIPRATADRVETIQRELQYSAALAVLMERKSRDGLETTIDFLAQGVEPHSSGLTGTSNHGVSSSFDTLETSGSGQAEASRSSTTHSSAEANLSSHERTTLINRGTIQDPPPIPKFILFSQAGKSSQLEQIDITNMPQEDRYLFAHLRKFHERSPDSKIRKLEHILPVQLRLPAWLRKFSFVNVDSAQYFQFELTPVGPKLCPINAGDPILPPITEVEPEPCRYLYRPCPMEGHSQSLMKCFAHNLRSPGPHLYKFWISRVPKRLHTRLLEEAGQRGWGLRFIERPNWILFTAFGTIVGFLASVIYAVITGDVASGFAIGAFLIAAQTMIVGARYVNFTDASTF